MSPRVREASHAGSWYVASGKKLDQQLSEWLAKVEPSTVPPPPKSVIDVDVTGDDKATSTSDKSGGLQMPVPRLKALIAPHAGYSYSGPAAAWAYASIDPNQFTRVFILGPSHHLYLDGCALSSCDAYATPLGDLPIDKATVNELRSTGEFERDMKLDVDEAEHSIEMHLPYIRKVFQDHEIQIVPILVGSISSKKEGAFGKLLAPYLADPTTLFVTSSDFCHWGTRFGYTYYNTTTSPQASISLSRGGAVSDGAIPIHASIRSLDGAAISHLTYPAQLPLPDPASPASSSSTSSAADAGPNGKAKNAAEAREAFASYLAKTKNTICGRHPIGVLLGALEALEENQKASTELRFTRYEQSSQCETVRDSSVSYASAIVRFQ